MDMSAGHAKSVGKDGHAPTAVICYDRFHVVALATKPCTWCVGKCGTS